MKILVTGGCGFVGRRFVKRFLDRGDHVTVVDNMVSGLPLERWMFPLNDTSKLRMLRIDARDFFRAELDSHRADNFDLIVHLAAIVGGRMTIENNPLLVATDLSIDAEMFNWAVRATRLPKVIYFSSSAVYPIELQTREHHCKLNEALLHFNGARVGLPDRTYGFAKLAGEYLAKFAVEQYGLDVKIYRPFGGYGEDQDLTYPFPSIIRRVLAGESPITVWGSGEQQRDFIHIEDVVDAVLATMDLDWGDDCPALNLGTGVATSFFQLARLARDELGHPGVDVVNDAGKPEGVFSRVADVYKLQQYYQPKIALWEGVRLVARAMERQLTTA